jgi:acyl carrier protein
LLIPIERLEGRRGDTLLLDALAGAARVHDLLCIAAVTGPPTTASEAAHLGALKGLLASMPHEREGWSTRWVEFPAGLGAAERASLLVAESETAGGDFAVGYGEAGRSHEVLAPDYFLTNHPPAVRSGGRYLVSGACGGLGRIVTQWLCEVWRAEVIGVGRTPAGSAAAPSHSRFRYVQADVTDAAALEAAVPEEALLDGVFHLAGDFELRDLDALDAARHERLTSAKVDGALQCVELLRRRGMPAPLFVLFGSVNSHFGGSGAASYAAANAAQQKLADHLNASGEITTYYLGWSQWPELGLSRANPAAALSERRGFLPIDASRGSSSLTRALAGPAGVLFIGLNSECPAIMGETGLRLAPPLLEIELAGDRARPPARILDRFGTAFDIRFEAPHAALLQTAGYRRMTEQITAIWQELLGQEAVDLDRNFFELGGNSLKLLQAKGRLESALRRPLEVADLLRYPTIRQLAAHLETATNRPADVRAASSLSTQASERGEARAARRTLRRRE